jgi:hypothetical protein
MPTVVLTIPKGTKEEFKEFPWVNWSEVSKETLIKQKEKVKLLNELEELTKHSTLTDEDCIELGRKVNKAIWERSKKEGLA